MEKKKKKRIDYLTQITESILIGDIKSLDKIPKPGEAPKIILPSPAFEEDCYQLVKYLPILSISLAMQNVVESNYPLLFPISFVILTTAVAFASNAELKEREGKKMNVLNEWLQRKEIQVLLNRRAQETSQDNSQIKTITLPQKVLFKTTSLFSGKKLLHNKSEVLTNAEFLLDEVKFQRMYAELAKILLYLSTSFTLTSLLTKPEMLPVLTAINLFIIVSTTRVRTQLAETRNATIREIFTPIESSTENKPEEKVNEYEYEIDDDDEDNRQQFRKEKK